jgi:DNA-binding transcriptional regulator WhiA
LKKVNLTNKKVLSYIIGVALGDGNLSNPNGRAVRLRITCDKKYPKLIKHIQNKIKIIFPENKVTLVDRIYATDISCYSNKWEGILNWRAKGGSKIKQKVGVPVWIKQNISYTIECLRGLLQTDGSIYLDRGYKMVNFTSADYTLIEDVKFMLEKTGFNTNIRISHNKIKNQTKYIIRISKNVENLIKKIDFWKE